MNPRILVTRPEPGAEATRQTLLTHGFDPVMLPLSSIVPVAAAAPADAERFSAVALTSANAVRNAAPELLQALGELPVYAVGAATADAARERGMQVIWIGSGDASALAGELANRPTAGQRVLYLTGRIRRPEFEETLARKSVPVSAVETYDTAILSYTTDTVLDLLSHETMHGVLVYSAVAGRALSGLISNPELGHLLESSWFICLSRRIAESLDTVDPERVLVTGSPSESAVLDLLNRTNFAQS